jgi:hypothetical protein
MSSIQSFLRQRSQNSTFFQAPTNNCYYIFVSGPGNYIGNYPPGYMSFVNLTEDVDVTGLLIRDMGKTIKATWGFGVNATPGFFRQVQLIRPTAAVSATGSTTFGVDSIRLPGSIPPGNSGDDGYGTYYIPIVIDGTLATSDGTTTVTLPSPYLPFGGQM